MDFKAIETVAGLFNQARLNGKQIFFIGNGGSAATAQHFATDLNHGATHAGKAPFRAISLTNNTALLTAVANDAGYEAIFERQFRNLLNPGDVVVAISASGNSPNILQALNYAHKHGAIVVGLIGFDGGKMKELCHHIVLVQTPPSQYGPVEDVHLILDHILSSYLRFIIGASAD